MGGPDALTRAEIVEVVPFQKCAIEALLKTQTYVNESGLIFVTDRLAGGLYILRLTGT